MYFVLNYNEGYEVGAVIWSEQYGRLHTVPLRNFGERQGDAKIFQLCDCPRLTMEQVKALAKRYDRNIKYQRISERQFKREGQFL